MPLHVSQLSVPQRVQVVDGPLPRHHYRDDDGRGPVSCRRRRAPHPEFVPPLPVQVVVKLPVVPLAREPAYHRRQSVPDVERVQFQRRPDVLLRSGAPPPRPTC